LSPSGNVEQFVDTIEIGESKTILRIVVWVFGYVVLWRMSIAIKPCWQNNEVIMVGYLGVTKTA